MKLAMAIRNFAKYCAAALVAAACTVQDPIDSQAPTNSEPVASNPPSLNLQLDDSLLALVEESGSPLTKSADLNGVLEELGILRLERIFPDAGEYEPRSRKMGLHRFYKAVLREGTPATKAAVSLSEVPGILSATPSHKSQKRSFNDPMLNKQWHYVNTSTPGADINVQGVWDNYTTGSGDVVVCVVDEPIDPTHEDLKANLWKDAQGHTGYNYVRKSYDLTILPADGDGDFGHGTHVAGTVAAVSNNGKGVAGIAGGDAANGIPGVRLMSHAIYSGTEEADDAATYRAIKEAADKGAIICSNSWGYGADGALGDGMNGKVSAEELAEYKSWEYDSALKAAIAYFVENAGCDAKGQQRADSPMKGGLVFFAAGNENIDYDYVGSNDPNAIAVGAFNKKGNKASYSNYGSWVDIAAPGGDGSSSSIWSTLPTAVEDGSGYGGTSWMGTSMACPHASGVAALIVSYFGGPGFTAADAKDILLKGLGGTIGGSRPVGGKLDALSSFEYGVQHYPVGGGQPDNPHPPVITLEKESVTLRAHQSMTVGFHASDPDGDALLFSCEPGSKAVSFNAEKRELTLTGWADEPGTYQAVITVTDATKRSAQATLEYTLLRNHAPEVVGQLEDVYLESLKSTAAISLKGLFTDPDGETLTLLSECQGNNLNLIQDASFLHLSASGYGIATVSLTARDFLGASARISFRVAVVNPAVPVRVTPEVAQDDVYIYITEKDPVTLYVSLYSSTGGLVLESHARASAFDPMHLDVSALAPGRYTAVLYYKGTTRQVRVVKY